MIESIVLEFENVTKFPMVDFLREYRDFMTNSYGPLNRYFSGNSESIDNDHINALKNITDKIAIVAGYFKNFENKFNKCGYWELMDLIDDLNTNIEKINKLPKFRRTTLGKRGYTNTVEGDGNVGAFRTIDDLANSMSGQNVDNPGWIQIMLHNDMDEIDWDIDKLSTVQVFYSKQRVNVSTIVDMPMGKRVYGIDMLSKLTFTDNDFQLVKYEDNIQQKCMILLQLKQGDVPENNLFGVSPSLTNANVSSFMFLEVARQLRDAFMQNDLFENVSVRDLTFDGEGNALANVFIKTKYDYSTEKTIKV